MAMPTGAMLFLQQHERGRVQSTSARKTSSSCVRLTRMLHKPLELPRQPELTADPNCGVCVSMGGNGQAEPFQASLPLGTLTKYLPSPASAGLTLTYAARRHKVGTSLRGPSQHHTAPFATRACGALSDRIFTESADAWWSQGSARTGNAQPNPPLVQHFSSYTAL